MSPSLSRAVPERLTLSPWAQNDVERNMWRANALAAAVVIAFAGLDWLRTQLPEGQSGQGLAVGTAVAKAMLYTGIPHYVIALLFMVTSPANRTRQRRTQLAGVCLTGLALCGLYAAVGGPPLPGASSSVRHLDGGFWARILPLSGLVAVYVFFLAHEISDETSFLRHPERQGTRVTAARQLVVCVLFPATVVILAAAGWIATAFGAYEDTQAILPVDTPFAARLAAAVAPLVVVVVVLTALWQRWTRRDGIDAWQICTDLWPELRICLLTITTIVAGLILTGRAYWIFLPHFAVWYLVAREKLPARRSPPPGWWQWIRNTRAGFTTLYASLALAVLLVGVGSEYAGASPDHGTLLSGGVFVHATIFHITASLLMPRART